MTCSFFGHRYVQKEIEPMLRSTLVDLIENYDCCLFYVGNQGGFDAMVTRVLRELSDRYPIRAYTVLAYLPTGEKQFKPFDAMKGLQEALKDREERHSRVEKHGISDEDAEANSRTIMKLQRGMKVEISYYKASPKKHSTALRTYWPKGEAT